MKVQGSGSGKALGIGELLASACSASAPLDRLGPNSLIISFSSGSFPTYHAGGRVLPLFN